MNLAILDRLARTELPARLTAVGMTADADAFATSPVIDRAARVATRATAARQLEDRIAAAWNPAWDVRWDARRFRALLTDAVEIADQAAGTLNERLLYKTCLRVASLLMCRAEAGG